ncbi:3-oxoacyl-ACP synthase [Legionella norrlandica]|uniref:3-oxoacyl-ACP synthase n=1 Tax=Legionella norrlandica TaxID=1498499 RepID=A0A0A2SWL0_9GAMM|nr:beta-ketoacyl-ACP synthase III [Legionella norrlandica]KGP64121.1 3-oxoacyl-ACP synthase [Legionella norrlandica]
MPSIKINGIGKYLPRNLISSIELDKKLNLPLGTVEKKSGLISRHFASPDETTSYMGGQAALKAIQEAGIKPNDIDLIISACGAVEQPIPSTSVLIQKQLGLESSGIACFDINSTCLSFLTALDTVSYLIDAGRYKRALIVSSDIPSLGLNWHDMETCTIFGDGAAACVIEKSDGSSKILSSHMETHSIGSSYCQVEAGGTRIPPSLPFDHQRFGLFTMDGKKVFKLATQLLLSTHQVVFSQAKLTLSDISWVIPHQASLLAMHHLRKRLNIPLEKLVNIYATHGNQMAASIPMALYRLTQSKKLKRGQRIYLLGTGAGLSSAGMILEY